MAKAKRTKDVDREAAGRLISRGAKVSGAGDIGQKAGREGSTVTKLGRGKGTKTKVGKKEMTEEELELAANELAAEAGIDLEQVDTPNDTPKNLKEKGQAAAGALKESGMNMPIPGVANVDEFSRAPDLGGEEDIAAKLIADAKAMKSGGGRVGRRERVADLVLQQGKRPLKVWGVAGRYSDEELAHYVETYRYLTIKSELGVPMSDVETGNQQALSALLRTQTNLQENADAELGVGAEVKKILGSTPQGEEPKLGPAPRQVIAPDRDPAIIKKADDVAHKLLTGEKIGAVSGQEKARLEKTGLFNFKWSSKAKRWQIVGARAGEDQDWAGVAPVDEAQKLQNAGAKYERKVLESKAGMKEASDPEVAEMMRTAKKAKKVDMGANAGAATDEEIAKFTKLRDTLKLRAAAKTPAEITRANKQAANIVSQLARVGYTKGSLQSAAKLVGRDAAPLAAAATNISQAAAPVPGAAPSPPATPAPAALPPTQEGWPIGRSSGIAPVPGVVAAVEAEAPVAATAAAPAAAKASGSLAKQMSKRALSRTKALGTVAGSGKNLAVKRAAGVGIKSALGAAGPALGWVFAALQIIDMIRSTSQAGTQEAADSFGMAQQGTADRIARSEEEQAEMLGQRMGQAADGVEMGQQAAAQTGMNVNEMVLQQLLAGRQPSLQKASMGMQTGVDPLERMLQGAM